MAAFPEEFDLDALLADRQLDRPRFQFRFGGQTYTLPPTVDVRFALALEAGQVGVAFRLLLGSEQWERFCASDAANALDDEGLKALMERWAAHTGANLGESSASTDSSVSTGGPSKPTSNGSTQPTLVR